MPLSAFLAALCPKDMQVLTWHNVNRLLQSQALPSGYAFRVKGAKYLGRPSALHTSIRMDGIVPLLRQANG